jgi:hypothetical protein
MIKQNNISIYFYDDKSYIPDNYLEDIKEESEDTIYIVKITILRYLNDKNINKSEKLELVINSQSINIDNIRVYSKYNVFLIDNILIKDNSEYYFILPTSIKTGYENIKKKNQMKYITDLNFSDNLDKDYQPEINEQHTMYKDFLTYEKYGTIVNNKLQYVGKKIIYFIRFYPNNKIIKIPYMIYEGFFMNDCLNGIGNIIYNDGTKYQGIFKNDFLNGLG